MGRKQDEKNVKRFIVSATLALGFLLVNTNYVEASGISSPRMDIAGPDGLQVRRESVSATTARSVATGIRNGGRVEVRAWMEGFFGDEMGTSSGWVRGNTAVTARSGAAGVVATARGAMR